MIRAAILTVSDSCSKGQRDDISGQEIIAVLDKEKFEVCDKKIVADDIYAIRAVVSNWIADPSVHAVITTGGTGVTGRDGTPEAISVLLDKEIEGFGELFRMISYQEIKTSSLQSRALAGVANGTYLFCLPGSSGACKTAWDEIIQAQLDHRTSPCNLTMLIPRLLET